MFARTRITLRSRTALAVMGIGMALLALPTPFRPALVWNFSISAPVGLYRFDARPWSRSDRVAVQPERYLSDQLAAAGVLERGRLLLKRVAAVSGDTVCRTGPIIAINGTPVATARLADANGRRLPSWSGCRCLRDGEVFLLGDGDRSFDGRYFGVTAAASILAPVSPVWLAYP